ncbi:Crp/Fnr family transcriptional regulator [Jiella pelagia]
MDKTAHQILLKRLKLVADIDVEDEAAVLELPVTVREIDAGIDIVSEGQYVSQCCILIDGFTYRYRHTLDGKRQIIAFHVSGDIPDLHSLHMNYMDHSFAATTRSRIGFVPHDAVWGLCLRRPNVAAALWRETLIDGAIFREWIVGLGRLSGLSRTAHLLCEIAMRMRSVGLAPDYVYRLPLTQHEARRRTWPDGRDGEPGPEGSAACRRGRPGALPDDDPRLEGTGSAGGVRPALSAFSRAHHDGEGGHGGEGLTASDRRRLMAAPRSRDALLAQCRGRTPRRIQTVRRQERDTLTRKANCRPIACNDRTMGLDADRSCSRFALMLKSNVEVPPCPDSVRQSSAATTFENQDACKRGR